MAPRTVIDGAIGGGLCQIEGCGTDAVGMLMWRHLPGIPGEGQAYFCGRHSEEIASAAFMAFWREFAHPSPANPAGS
jgi:hypothetical protein